MWNNMETAFRMTAEGESIGATKKQGEDCKLIFESFYTLYCKNIFNQ